MKMTRSHLLATILLLGIAAGGALAQTNAAPAAWPTWRGPAMTGIATQANPPVTFGEKENLCWKVPVPGTGRSTPVIWGDKLFLLTAVPTDQPGAPSTNAPAAPPPDAARFGIKQVANIHQFNVLCLNRRTGQTLWTTTVRAEVPHEGHHPDHSFASASPVTDGVRLWAFFGSRGLHSLDLDGKLLWSRDLGKMLTRNSFGEASSPTLADGMVIALLDQEEGSAVAGVNAATGAVAWRVARDERTSWTTPLAITHEGRTQVVVAGTTLTRSYDPRTGAVLWQCGGQTLNVIPTPVTGFGCVFCTSGYKGNTLQAIALGRTGELTGTDAVRWQMQRNTPYVPSPLLYGERLYLFSGNTARLSCLNARTGQPHYETQRIEGLQTVYASPAGAAGRLYVADRSGAVAVVEDGDTFKVLAVNKLDEGCDASPAIVGNALYLRGHKSLYCFGKVD